MATPVEQLEAMRGLAVNWDGYGAAPPQTEVINLARAFVELIVGLRKDLGNNGTGVHVTPGHDGGVLIEWEDASKEHELEVKLDGSISFLHLEKTTGGIETRKFHPQKAAVVQAKLLQELKYALAA